MKKTLLNKNKQIKKNVFDCLIPIIFVLSMIIPIIVSQSQEYIVQYGDDISVINWAKDHTIFDIFTSKLGTGYRPIMNFFYVFGYTIWGSEASFYYLFSGLLFSGGMIFLYLLGKTLHSKLAGISAVLLYLFFDASFILISKINFIVTTGEIFFITSALYFSIQYFKDKNNTHKYLAISLSILAFLTKEPSILIIPIFILTYLYLNGQLNKKYIIICIIPLIYLLFEMIFIASDIGGGNSNIIERIINNTKFYLDTEITSQFKIPILLGISILIASYYASYRNLKKEIFLCVVWFIVGILPFLVTQQPVQPTYLAESNIGVVLLIGIVISESTKKVDWITALLILGIITQVAVIPNQISNMQNYNRMISDNQNTFRETMIELNSISTSAPVFYLSEEIRNKYGGYQITEDFFRQYLHIKDININVTTNYIESEYIILPSSLDVQIFQKEYPDEINKLQIIKQIQNNNDYGFILKKV